MRPSEDVCAIVLSSRGAVTDKVPGRDRSEQTKTTDNINEVNKNKTKQNKYNKRAVSPGPKGSAIAWGGVQAVFPNKGSLQTATLVQAG